MSFLWRRDDEMTSQAQRCADPAVIQPALLAWYDRHKRDLPWRQHPEPWAVWVSEIMLQQTRVDSVIGYFKRFMKRFPTPRDLADADLDELMGYWAGLGYYARARNLHAGATQVVERHNGEVPDDPDAFAELKGIGRYTCGAVQSIAFGNPLPVLDGNVIRVIARLDYITADPKSAATNRSLWSRADELLDRDRPGDFNQAMMELGATVCTPRNPKCLLCPIKAHCRVLEEDDPERLPTKTKRKKRPRHDVVAALIQTADHRIWLGRRPLSGLLGGLWSLPSLRGDSPERLHALGITGQKEVARIEHGFTHQIWSVRLYEASGIPQGSLFEKFAAFNVSEIAELGLAGPSLKALRAAGIKLPHRRGAGKQSTVS
jgi:A/G-specific adenine glycosylase